MGYLLTLIKRLLKVRQAGLSSLRNTQNFKQKVASVGDDFEIMFLLNMPVAVGGQKRDNYTTCDRLKRRSNLK